MTPVHEHEPRTWGPAEADRIIAHGGEKVQPEAGHGGPEFESPAIERLVADFFDGVRG